MARVDLHVHTKHSDHPSEWFLQRLGASECYTEPADIISAADERGMDLVAVTDHNCIDGALGLAEMYPDRVIVGVEVTAYFPEDGCKVHVLLFGVTPEQFEEVQRVRSDIYRFREYVRDAGIAHSVAHATYSINDRLTIDHLERLIVLFDVFEVINGSRDEPSNRTWEAVLRSLTPGSFEALAHKHGIAPMGPTSWAKGYTAGSDDHAGLLVGRTWTEAAAATPREFVDAVRSKGTTPAGRHNDFRTLAFAIYKIAWEFSRSKDRSMLGPVAEEINEALFARTPGRGLGERLLFQQKRAFARFSSDPLTRTYLELVDSLHRMRGATIEARLDSVFETVTALCDELTCRLVRSLQADLNAGNMSGAVQGVASALPALFLSAPFYSTMAHLNRGRPLLRELERSFGMSGAREGRRVLWFTDTIADLNGVSVTLQTIARLAEERGDELHVVAAPASESSSIELPARVMTLETLGGFELPYYEGCELQIPAVMRSLERVHAYAPDRVYVSTPGPVGLLGLLAARLLGAECVAVYHTDFTRQAQRITEDGSASGMAEAYTRWFYSLADEIHVPSNAYIDDLVARGFDRCSMRVFRRGIDTRVFAPRTGTRERTRLRYGLGQGPVWLYAGRLARDKNLPFAFEAFRALLAREPEASFLIVGDGPHAEELRATSAGCGDRVVFCGEVAHDELPELYSGADLLVFPSVNDTFGMAVLEAQACGLPAIVSDTGGPQEIVVDGVTGRVLPVADPLSWTAVGWSLVADNVAHTRMREAARAHAARTYDWNEVLDGIVCKQGAVAPDHPAAHVVPSAAG